MNARRGWMTMVLLACAAAAAAAEPVPAGEPAKAPAATAKRRLFPLAFPSAPPGSTFYPVQAPGPYPPHVAPAPVATFSWGYFGARTNVRGGRHEGYYGDVTDRFYPVGNR